MLENSERGECSRRDILETLGISLERFATVREDLLEDGSVETISGRLGGLRLVLSSRTTKRRHEQKHAPATSAPESALYAPFEKYLLHVGEAEEDATQSRSIVVRTHKQRRGKWERPDLVEVRVAPLPMIGQWDLRVIAYELKRADAWSVDSVLQAASYAEFAHESWLVVPAAKNTAWDEHFGREVISKAAQFSIGLGSFSARDGILTKHTTARIQTPAAERVHEWLSGLIEGEQAKRLAENIRWAKAKADAAGA